MNKIFGIIKDLKTLETKKSQIPRKQIVFVESEGLIWTHGKLYAQQPDVSKFITSEEFTNSIDTSNVVNKSDMATINGQSLINRGNIEIDSSIYKVVTTLPTENQNPDKIYLMKAASSTSGQTDFECWKWTGTEWTDLGPFGSVKIDLSAYLSKAEADSRYMIKSANQNSSLIVLDNGQVNNLGNNGQAFNAIRKITTDDYKGATGSGYPINCASFGVKLDGTTAFSHKKYDSYTYNKTNNTDKTTGAKNTAVLVFSGNSGLLYAKNTGAAADVTSAMYRRVGVIDSPDEAQQVYSVAQTDAKINTLIQEALAPIVANFNDQISALQARIQDLESQLSGGEGIEGSGREGIERPDMIGILQSETTEILESLPGKMEEAVEEVTPDYSSIPDTTGSPETDV